MITLKELNPRDFPVTAEIKANLETLLCKVNIIRAAYGKPMLVSSGLRDQALQQSLISSGRSNAPKSKHLTGQAVDFVDSDGKLTSWCKEHPAVLEKAGLWCEEGTVGWVHVQSVPPKSGKRWFLP